MQGTRMTFTLSGQASFLELREISDTAALIDDLRVGGDGATLLWHALKADATRLELVDRLTSEYRCDRQQAAFGTDRFLARLRRRGLLVES